MTEVQDIPQAVTMSRIRSSLRALEISSMMDDDGDVCIQIFPNVFYVVSQEDRPFIGISVFHRSIDVRFAEQASEFVRIHNRDLYSPKLFTVMTDEGKIRFRVAHYFGWDAGATDSQIRVELDVFFRSTSEAFERLEQAFADPWLQSITAEGEE